MRRLIGSILASWAFLCFCHSQEPRSSIEAIAWSLLGKGNDTIYERTKDIDQATRLALVDYLRREAPLNKANEESYDAILTFLGDEATFQKYAQGHKWRLLAWTKNPRAVDFIAAGLMVNDDNPAYETPSHDAASQLAVVLLDWPEIPSEVSGWVMKFRGWIMNARDTRQLMREWWLANEAAWRRRDFAALKPGRDLVGRDLIDPRTLPSAPAPPPVLPAAATPAPPPIPESPAPTATPELLPPQDHGSPWAFLSVVAACIAALAGVLWLWRKTG